VHELNNPLTSIVTYSEYLHNKSQAAPGLADGTDREDAEKIRRIGEAALRILKFSRALVAYARPARHEPCAVNLHDIIERALVFCEHEFVEHGVRVEKHLPNGLPAVQGVSDQLTQVFVNLFVNAAHAMRARGGLLSIAVVADYQTERVHVEIADQGIGIDAANVERIFEPFFTTKPEGHGTGLGLSIVREIVKTHGGSLSAESVQGQGSVFRLCLPMAVGQQPPGGSSVDDEDLQTRP
jgi:two-component system, NtrC family, sensor kinase